MQVKKDGFMLLEALAAIAIIGMVLTPIFILQGSIQRRVSTVSQQMREIIFARRFIADARIEVQKRPEDTGEFTLENKDYDPGMKLTYILKPVDTKSSLGSITGLLIEQVQIARPRGGRDTILVSFVSPEERKET